MTSPLKVAVLGASNNPDRISNLLIRRLLAKGHEVFPVNPALKTIEGLTVVNELSALPNDIDVLTLYVNAERSSVLADQIEGLKAKRVVFNPGAENPALQLRLSQNGTETSEACSLVLLSQNQL